MVDKCIRLDFLEGFPNNDFFVHWRSCILHDVFATAKRASRTAWCGYMFYSIGLRAFRSIANTIIPFVTTC